ncbi:glutathione peroxidase [Mucilaginibacter sp. PPCGB 2223]|uniref:glutathione peroxidase n=1 Tax=Mucilaginibacter sp. PPCGB 2223 TaxID=1886027 RepID=UPI000826E0AF|nr:glutathione peroxidase [Mucilaginibacter sp. PPCGB 2223]OCX51346.1 glutathione peroxidase [Mucilaginibacter sp. PPCGB 2223]
MSDKSIYQFDVEKLNGEKINLSIYKGKVLLIVNTASECGFTPQLKDLELLRDQFAGRDFEILAFPSNDFGGQEPLEGSAIGEFCEINYGVHFTTFNKIRVRGPYAHPLYQFLADRKLNGRIGVPPRWNFHKYLVNANGEVVDFFYPFTKPTTSKIKKRIERLLTAV